MSTVDTMTAPRTGGEVTGAPHGQPRWAFSRLALALLLGGFVLRLALMRLTEGNDFIAFGKLALLTLHGHDVYWLRLHNHLRPVLPWNYLPLLLYMFTGLQWLAVHTGWPFLILGKLPITLADLAVGALLYAALRRRGHGEPVALLGMCLYLYNPLVLYNGPFYGRFDAIALAFLMLALENYRSRLFAPLYALAISAKTFPLFLVPPLALGHDRQRWGRLALALVLTILLALPYLISDPQGLLHIFHYVRPNFGRLSWYYVLLDNHVPPKQVFQLARYLMLLYPAIVFTFVRGSRYVKTAETFALYLILNQVLYEQYLEWPLPFLIVVGLHERSRLALWLVGLLTLAGMLENEFTWERYGHLHYHLAPTPWVPLNAVLALSVLAFIVTRYFTGRKEPATEVDTRKRVPETNGD